MNALHILPCKMSKIGKNDRKFERNFSHRLAARMGTNSLFVVCLMDGSKTPFPITVLSQVLEADTVIH